MNKLPQLLFAFLLILLTVSSCKKDKEDEMEPTPEPGVTKDLSLHFSSRFGEEDFTYNTIYNLNGVEVQFQDVRFYLSNFEIIDALETTINSNKVLLIDAENASHFDLISLDPNVNEIQDLNFKLGLDYDTNHADPTTAEAPLNDGTMHWGWNPDAGYKFVKIEGTRDITGDGVFEAFSFHVAGDQTLREIERSLNTSIEESSLMLHFMIDYKTWFENVDFSDESISVSHGNTPLNNGISDQFNTSLMVMN